MRTIDGCTAAKGSMLLPEFHTTPVRPVFAVPVERPTATFTRSSGAGAGVLGALTVVGD
jgi:hypothetical protein